MGANARSPPTGQSRSGQPSEYSRAPVAPSSYPDEHVPGPKTGPGRRLEHVSDPPPGKQQPPRCHRPDVQDPEVPIQEHSRDGKTHAERVDRPGVAKEEGLSGREARSPQQAARPLPARG